MTLENGSVFGEISNDSAVTWKRVSIFPVCLHEAKWPPGYIQKIIMNNSNINGADMSQLYFMLGITEFVRLCFSI